MRIGVISDTHGRLEARVLDLFQGVDRILHAGDVGTEEVLETLESVAPVTAVYGNVDGMPLVERLREAECFEEAGLRFLILHQIGSPERLAESARLRIRERRPDVMVFGHTHAVCDRVVDGIRFLNPGGSGPRRFGLPRTVALLEANRGEIAVRFVEIDPPGPTRQPERNQ
jgi:putative phosphoesterase